MKPDFYAAYRTLDAAKQMTGNDAFAEIAALLKDCERLYSLTGTLLCEFPTRDDDSYYNSKPESLQTKVNKRLAATKELFAHIRKMREEPES